MTDHAAEVLQRIKDRQRWQDAKNAPTAIGTLVAEYRDVFRVQKQCRGCGARWEGNAFAPENPEASPRAAWCDVCIAHDEALVEDGARRDIREVSVTDLQPMREPGE